jgi:hypothetical protein
VPWSIVKNLTDKTRQALPNLPNLPNFYKLADFRKIAIKQSKTAINDLKSNLLCLIADSKKFHNATTSQAKIKTQKLNIYHLLKIDYDINISNRV